MAEGNKMVDDYRLADVLDELLDELPDCPSSSDHPEAKTAQTLGEMYERAFKLVEIAQERRKSAGAASARDGFSAAAECLLEIAKVESDTAKQNEIKSQVDWLLSTAEKLSRCVERALQRLSSGSKHILCICLCLHQLMWMGSGERLRVAFMLNCRGLQNGIWTGLRASTRV